jgi:hypothetical protein
VLVDELRGAAFGSRDGPRHRICSSADDQNRLRQINVFLSGPQLPQIPRIRRSRSTRVDRDFERTDPPFRTETFSNFRHTILPQENDFARHSFCFTFGSGDGVASFVAVASDFKLHRCGSYDRNLAYEGCVDYTEPEPAQNGNPG